MEILPELTVMGEKGQVVIPKRLRSHLRLGPRARFVVYGSGEVIILKRLELHDLGPKWRQVMQAVDAQLMRSGAGAAARKKPAPRKKSGRARK